MNTRTIPTSTICEEPTLCEDKVIVKQRKMDGYVKTWFCDPMTIEEYEIFLMDIKKKHVVTLHLREGR